MRTALIIGATFIALPVAIALTVNWDNKGLEDKIIGVIGAMKEGKDYRTYFSKIGRDEIREICEDVVNKAQ